MLDKELVQQLYSSKVEAKRAAVYRLLFDRRYDLLDELKKAATFEKDEAIAVFMVQVCLTLESFPRDYSLERRIVELLQKEGGTVGLSEEMWTYLETHGSSQMLLAALGAMGDAIPPSAQDFIETCLTNPDPEIRAATCQKAIKSGRPTHFAFVLNLITDPDPIVSQTAFMVIKELPGEELSIILDYALGSPDEWVLDNVAPFLPLIINNAVRKVIAKVSYHKHPMIAKKAREALKQLDSIPFISKRKAEAEAVSAAEKAVEEKEGETVEDGSGDDGEKKLSLKEQMEIKRQQKLEADQKRQAEEEAMAAELASVKPEDLDELAGEISRFNADPGSLPVHADDSTNADQLMADEQTLSENTGFENESRVLDDIEVDDAELEKILAQTTTVSAKSVSGMEMSLKPEEEEDIVVLDPKTIDLERAQAQFDRLAEPASDGLVTQAPVSVSVAPEVKSDDEDIEILVVDETEVSKPVVAAVASQTSKPSISETAAGERVAARPAGEIAAGQANRIVDVAAPSGTPAVSARQVTPAKPEQLSAATQKPVSVAPGMPTARPQAKPVAAGARPVLPPEAREIAARYPSFLADPFVQLFVPASNEAKLAQIGLVLDNLTAFLNLSYLQSCLFFAPESEMLARSIIDCVKGDLIGPTALRCLHNFVLSMKQASGNPVFFTFALTGVLSNSSDTNPLMMMRELKEYLREPATPLEESIPQAIEGVTEILRGVKSLVSNLLVMKAPPGAKEPFADLSGPEARILPIEKRPGLDVPVGEVVLISRDGTEALGLFPYFKYSRKKVVYAKPSIAERNILLERLEIPVEEFGS